MIQRKSSLNHVNKCYPLTGLYVFYLQRKITVTASKISKYGVFSAAYFPVFGLNTGKYGPEKNLYLDTFHAVC